MPGHQREFSLGAAAFDFPAADDCAHPTQHALDSWRRAFSTEHTDAPVWSGIHTSCRAGQRLALQEARHVRLRLDCTMGQTSVAWQRRLAAVQEALSLRSPSLPTSLSVFGDDTAGSAAAALVLPQALQGAGQCITALTFTPPLKPHTTAPAKEHLSDDSVSVMGTWFLAAAAQAFPRLRSLTLLHTTATLPPPSQLPHVEQLVLSGNNVSAASSRFITALNKSIAPYLPQLTSLQYLRARDSYWPILLTPRTTTHTLPTLATADDLSDALLGLLFAHTPALKQLKVS